MKNGKNSFDRNEIEWDLDMMKLISIKPIKSLMQLLIHSLNYAQIPIFKIMKTVGTSFTRLFGIGRTENEVVRLKEYLMPLEDGAKLATDIYLPKNIFKEKAKGPTILVRLPYWKDSMSIIGYLVASLGYVTVLQDIRGCAHSRDYGTNSFTFFETSDGLETVRWVSKRFWFDGRLGMIGGSYFGLTQLAISERNDGLLTCLCPSQCSYANFLYHAGGLYQLGRASALFPIYNLVTCPEMDFNIARFDKEGLIEKMVHNPLANLYNEPLNSQNSVISFEELANLETPQERIDLVNERLGLQLKMNEKDTGQFAKFLKEFFYNHRIDLNYELFTHVFGFQYKPTTPMYQTGGLFDLFLEENIRDLKNLLRISPDYCKNQYRLVIGPWTHGGLGNMTMPPQMNLKEMIIVLRNFFPYSWLEYWLRGAEKKSMKGPLLRIYVLNKKIWRNFNFWPPKTHELNFYLHSNGHANSRSGDGMISTTLPEKEPADEYDFNPAYPVLTKGGRNLMIGAGQLNQTKTEERADILVYTSEKLKEGIEVIGEVKIIFYASSSAKDTDFMVKLVDVLPNGKTALNLIDNGLRARYRGGDLKNPTLLEPYEAYCYEIDLGTTAIYFPKKHQIRIEISSSNYPKYDINSNLGGERNEERFIIAHQKILHDSQHPSHLILPIFR